MAELDFSTYPKAAAPQSALDIAGKLGGMQSQALGINQQKLDQANQALGFLTRAFNSVGPDGTKEDYAKVGVATAKAFDLPPQMLDMFMQKLQAAPDAQSFFNEITTQAANHTEVINHHLGPHGLTPIGNAIVPTRAPGKPGASIYSTGAPIQMQPPVTQPEYDTNNQLKFRGAQPPEIAPGAVAAPPFAPSALPIKPVPTVSFNKPITDKNQSRLPIALNAVAGGPVGAAAGPTPMFEEGKKQLAADQELATQKLTAIKPALQVLPYLKDIMAGPGTDRFTKAVAALKGFGILPTGTADKDNTAIRQIVAKKLAQYVSSNPVGQRSDAAQTLAEASSPNPNVQILPALEKLTKDSIILDRVQAARPGSFKDTNHANYGNHRSTFPAKVDERAFGLDLMPVEERKKLLSEMLRKQNTFEGKKFWDTMKIVDEQGLIDTGAK